MLSREWDLLGLASFCMERLGKARRVSGKVLKVCSFNDFQHLAIIIKHPSCASYCARDRWYKR